MKGEKKIILRPPQASGLQKEVQDGTEEQVYRLGIGGGFILSLIFPGRQILMRSRRRINIWEGNLGTCLIGNGEGKSGKVELKPT